MDNCNHNWIANSGKGGKPVFKANSQMSSFPVMHAKCKDCGARTWFHAMSWKNALKRKA